MSGRGIYTDRPAGATRGAHMGDARRFRNYEMRYAARRDEPRTVEVRRRNIGATTVAMARGQGSPCTPEARNAALYR